MLCQANIKHLPIVDESIDLIFTDPPYMKMYLPCYKWLAFEAARVLKPNRFVFAMAGHYWLPNVFRIFGECSSLSYFWCFTHLSRNDAPMIWPRGIIARSKSILAYNKLPSTSKGVRVRVNVETFKDGIVEGKTNASIIEDRMLIQPVTI